MSIASVLAEGRLIRHAWAREEDGRQLLCLYTAMLDDPEARPVTCPASLCAQWLAHLLPWMDDEGTDEAWPAMVVRVATLAPQFHRLRPQVEWQVRAACVREAMRHTTDAMSLATCETVATLCVRRGLGEHVSDNEMETARERAVGAAAWAVAWAGAADAADAAARAVMWAAGTAAVEVEAADRLTTAILDLIQADLAATEETR